LYIKSLKPIRLSHHPNCEEFNNHTIKIGKKKFCIGCFIGYPSAIIGVISIYFLNLFYILDSKLLFIIAIVLMSSFLLSPLGLTRIKWIKIVQKILFNLGGAFLFWWIFLQPNSFIVNFLLFFLIFGILLSLTTAYHAYGFYKVCKQCLYNLDWENCSGFKEVFEYCDKNELPNLFKSINRNRKVK
jgi:predicted neutral ceramidase superfamily lipid hydrolase